MQCISSVHKSERFSTNQLHHKNSEKAEIIVLTLNITIHNKLRLFPQGPTRIPKQFEAVVTIDTELTEIS